MGDNGGGGAVPAAAAVSVEWLQKQLDAIDKLPIPKKEKKKLSENAVLQMQQKQAQELGLPPPAPPRGPPRATVGQMVTPPALADGQLHSDGSNSTSLEQQQQLLQTDAEKPDRVNLKQLCTKMVAEGPFIALAVMLKTTLTRGGIVPGAQHYGTPPLASHPRPAGNGSKELEQATSRTWASAPLHPGGKPNLVLLQRQRGTKGAVFIPPEQPHFGLEQFCHPVHLRTEDGDGGPQKIGEELQMRGITLIDPSQRAPAPASARVPQYAAASCPAAVPVAAAAASMAHVTVNESGEGQAASGAAEVDPDVAAAADAEEAAAADQSWADVRRWILYCCIVLYCIVLYCIVLYCIVL